MTIRPPTRELIAVVGLVALLLPLAGARAQPIERLPLVCGTPGTLALRTGLSDPAPLPDGEPLFFEQQPAVLTADFVGTIRLRDLLVLGDVPTVTFEYHDSSEETPRTETWTRRDTRVVRGRTVSVFNPSWSSDELGRVLSRQRQGFDDPSVYWGRVITETASRWITLRFAPTGLPASRVVTLDPDVQYASHVVNLRLPDFGEARVEGGRLEFEQTRVAQAFYTHFADVYDGLAIVPQAVHLANVSGTMLHVRNQVDGIGLAQFDDSARYGSDGRLQSVETYPSTAFATHDTSNHEIAHKWGHYFEWDEIAGIEGAGHAPASHTPLVGWHETLLGAVLEATRRVRPDGEGQLLIQRTPGPIRFHPLQRYAMGLLSADDVPPISVFEEQDQFSLTSAAAPEPGTVLSGGTRRVTIDDIVARHGARTGPAARTWRRATIVVSRGTLLTAEEMSYWNFFAQRLEDPDRTGVASLEGYVSFDAATHGAGDLQTDIVPLVGARVVERLEVSAPDFGARDWPGVAFDQPVPSHYRVGEPVVLQGTVVDRTRSDFHLVRVHFWKHDSDERVAFWRRLSSSKRFGITVDFAPGQEGLYRMAVYVFWPDAPGQRPRATMTPVVVD